jgi:hypothetical protein
MDVVRIPPLPSPWPDRIARDLQLLLLSAIVAGGVWLVRDWQQADRLAPTLDPPTLFEYDDEPDDFAPLASGVLSRSVAVVQQARPGSWLHIDGRSVASADALRPPQDPYRSPWV